MFMLYEKDDTLSCPLNWAMSVIHGKWKPYIIWYLSDNDRPARYSELKRMIPFDISHKVFSQQLKELVRDGVVSRTATIADDHESLLQVEYRLTPQGKSLGAILYLLRDWGSLFGSFDDPAGVLANGKGRQIRNKRIYYAGDAGEAKDGSDFIVWIRARNAPSSEANAKTEPAIANAC